MRQLAGANRIRLFMRELALAASSTVQVYFAGGATAVLLGWRQSTLDIDLKLVPDQDSLLRAIPALKESLQLNVELAAPDDFIPVAPSWQEHSPFIAQEGRLTFRHFDFSSQALAKIERGHAQDLSDLRAMLNSGLVSPEGLRQTFEAIEPHFYRYPALDPASFRKAVEAALRDAG